MNEFTNEPAEGTSFSMLAHTSQLERVKYFKSSKKKKKEDDVLNVLFFYCSVFNTC